MTYTAALVGLSEIGARHLEAFDGVADIEVVGIADVDTAALEERGAEWNIPPDRRYSDHADLLAAEAVDVLSIATPSFLHREHVIDAVDSAASPDVIWAEKPVATSVAAADEMIEACERTGTELVINHTRRFGTPYRQLRGLIQDDRILGDVRSINVTAPEELLRNGTHSIDLANFILSAPYEWGSGHLTGHSDRMDEAFDDSGGAGMLTTGDGAYVHVDCTVPRGMHDGTWNIVGSEGKLVVEAERNVCRYWSLEESDSAPYGIWHVERELPRAMADFTDRRAMFREGARHVVELLDGTTENLSPGTDARHVLEAIVALFISHHTGSAIDLPLERPLRDVRIRSH